MSGLKLMSLSMTTNTCTDLTLFVGHTLIFICDMTICLKVEIRKVHLKNIKRKRLVLYFRLCIMNYLSNTQRQYLSNSVSKIKSCIEVKLYFIIGIVPDILNVPNKIE